MTITRTLRPYQVEIGRAVLDSVLNRLGRTFTVEIARQGGKNELSAQIETLLLTLHMGVGGTGIKCAPTFVPQALISMERLKARLDEAGYHRYYHTEHGYILRLGRAGQRFYSADGSASVVGATADLLLEVDEAQDVDPDKYQKEFRPMGASTNVTTVLWGTPWDGETLLEQQKQINLELERKDGVRRHFRFDWHAVAEHNPTYGEYVSAEEARLGSDHPLFRTQYCLEPLTGGLGLLSTQQLAWIEGEHGRLHAPVPSTGSGNGYPVYVAGVDLGGAAWDGDSTSTDDAVRRTQPHRDSTVVTIARVVPSANPTLVPAPTVEVVEHLWWTGHDHASLVGELAGLLGQTWRCRRVVVDATGLGTGITSMLQRLLGGSVVQPFVFSAESKSKLGYGLLAALNLHRLKLYAADGSAEYQECRRQLQHAQGDYRRNQRMNFYVKERDGHDDFLMSLALTLEAASMYQPRSARGRTNNDE